MVAEKSCIISNIEWTSCEKKKKELIELFQGATSKEVVAIKTKTGLIFMASRSYRIQVVMRSPIPGMTTTFHERPDDRFINIK